MRCTPARHPKASGDSRACGGGIFPNDPEHLYLYTADEERILDFRIPPPGETRLNRWTFRGVDGRVVRELVHDGEGTTKNWRIERDFVYRGGALVAGWDRWGNRYHFTTDHLGTPRLITDDAGNRVSSHVYDPFGIELSSPTQNTSRLEFTGHERDFWSNQWFQGDDLESTGTTVR